MLTGSRLCCTLAIAATTGPALAQQASDTCAGAPFIALNGDYVSTSIGADSEFFGLCGLADAFDVWFRVTAASAGEHTFLVSSVYMDTTVAIFSACGIEGFLDCNDDGPDGTDSVLTFPLNAGDTVYIRISGNALDDGPFRIRVNGPVAQPPIGACCHGSTCASAVEASCTGFAMHWAGAATVCNAPGSLTGPCCKGDFNQAGGVTVQDIFDFLVAYFAGDPSADINELDGVTVGDIFTFLVAYFGGCA